MKKLIAESLQELFESPDSISLPNLEYNYFGEPINNEESQTLYFDDKDTYPFWIYDGEIILGLKGGSHGSGSFPRSGAQHYPGRIWINSKIISFWEYPDKELFFDIIKFLSEKLGEDFSDWRVEILDPDQKENGNKDIWKQKVEYKSRLIPVLDYEGSENRSDEELWKEHSKSPLFKKRRKVPYGYGSKNPKYIDKRKWQMASLTSEGAKGKKIIR